MRFISLFSGIEAASVALHPIGWEPAAYAEIEAFPCDLLAKRFPGVPNLGDVQKIEREHIRELGHVDVVIGGFPCQDVSIAGRRAGLENEDGTATRSGLFFDAVRIADWSEARFTWLENVLGLFSSNGGKDFAAVVGELSGAVCCVPRDGWRNSGVVVGPRGLVEWCVLDAQYHGLAQRRERVFIVRDTGNWLRRPPLFLESSRLRGDSPPRREAREGITGALTARAGSGGPTGEEDAAGKVVPALSNALSHREAKGQASNAAQGTPLIPVGVAGALMAKGKAAGSAGNFEAESNHLVTHGLRGAGHDASEDGSGRGTPLVVTPFNEAQITNQDNRSNPQPGDPAPTIAPSARPPTIAFNELADPVAANQQRTHTREGKNFRVSNVAIQTTGVRRLTPRECERLQGFPDDFTQIPRGKKGKSTKDAPRYAALGNSMAVPCIRYIGELITNAKLESER